MMKPPAQIFQRLEYAKRCRMCSQIPHTCNFPAEAAAAPDVEKGDVLLSHAKSDVTGGNSSQTASSI